ncbi:Ribosomal large subunit pseudouridine synthase F [Acholeplasma oculi]|uniref:Pseudouridine synthase n=2 Tax=Acholeplasma oculi TaxID=35623 RepID=A0A061AA66_9MOLU|nr:pseudouridine synthase [Acholeplasma oculi]CDR30795.1 RNA pseudouridine synthase [Acholeplasma oculi]SKC35007.1 23S rRNA pseudouridine2604 synthase [Acholeplasma oculi]SUT89760.1 Ribosomal large subunit pseudouridine synthase F [Acholeplasma oculi]
MLKAKQLKTISKTEEIVIKHDLKEQIRLNKFLSDQGLTSRRKSDEMISVGRVTVNDELAKVGTKISSSDIVKVDGKVIANKPDPIYIALNKPKGIVTTTDKAIRSNIIDFMDYPEMIFPVGRLDKDSSGLILLTNDGDIVNKILRVENGHDKEYIVEVDKDITDEFLDAMEKGVIIYNPVTHQNQRTLPTKLKKIDHRSFSIILRQGLNRQIRRMTENLGFHVVELKRIRIMHIYLNDLQDGYWRYLTKDELIQLNQAITKKT